LPNTPRSDRVRRGERAVKQLAEGTKPILCENKHDLAAQEKEPRSKPATGRMITIDRQVVVQHCEGCKRDFTVVRGSVFEEGEPFGLYLVALHGHAPGGRLAHLALGLLDRVQPTMPPVAVAIEVLATANEFRHSVVDWPESPWAHEEYLGRMLDREEALASPMKPLVFHVADHILEDVPEVQAYFA
jgi:hypothetical protein